MVLEPLKNLGDFLRKENVLLKKLIESE